MNEAYWRIPEGRYSRELRGLIEWMLTKEASERPSIGEILADERMQAKLSLYGGE